MPHDHPPAETMQNNRLPIDDYLSDFFWKNARKNIDNAEKHSIFSDIQTNTLPEIGVGCPIDEDQVEAFGDYLKKNLPALFSKSRDAGLLDEDAPDESSLKQTHNITTDSEAYQETHPLKPYQEKFFKAGAEAKQLNKQNINTSDQETVAENMSDALRAMNPKEGVKKPPISSENALASAFHPDDQSKTLQNEPETPKSTLRLRSLSEALRAMEPAEHEKIQRKTSHDDSQESQSNVNEPGSESKTKDLRASNTLLSAIHRTTHKEDDAPSTSSEPTHLPKYPCIRNKSKHRYVTPNVVTDLMNITHENLLYIIDEKGRLRIASKDSLTRDDAGRKIPLSHMDLSKGKPVISAGTVLIEQGKISEITNGSSDYSDIPEYLPGQGFQVDSQKILIEDAFLKHGYSNVKDRFIDVNRNRTISKTLNGAKKHHAPENAVSNGLNSSPSSIKQPHVIEDNMSSFFTASTQSKKTSSATLKMELVPVDFEARKVKFISTTKQISMPESTKSPTHPSNKSIPKYAKNQSKSSIFRVSSQHQPDTSALDCDISSNNKRVTRMEITTPGGCRLHDGTTIKNPKVYGSEAGSHEDFLRKCGWDA